jgi:hypothetical protein
MLGTLRARTRLTTAFTPRGGTCRSPSASYGTYGLYTGVYNQPYLYRVGEGWESSLTQVSRWWR